MDRQGRGIECQQLLNKQERERIDRTNLYLLKDAAINTLTALVPYVLMVLTVYELLTYRRVCHS